MSRAEGYKLIQAYEMEIARYVLMGEIEWARRIALYLAEVRDGMLTRDEFTASLVRA